MGSQRKEHIWNDALKAYVQDAQLLAKDRHQTKLSKIWEYGEANGKLRVEDMRFLDSLFFNF